MTGSMKNINHNLKNENFSFIEHDICNPIEIKNKLDYIYILLLLQAQLII